MRTLFLSALVGASISFASYTVQANQTWQGRGVVQSISDNAVMLRHEAIPGDEVTFTLERAGDGFQIISLTPAR